MCSSQACSIMGSAAMQATCTLPQILIKYATVAGRMQQTATPKHVASQSSWQSASVRLLLLLSLGTAQRPNFLVLSSR